MDDRLCQRLERLAGRSVSDATRVERGYTPAERWVLRFSDGSSAFAKIATTAQTADALRAEHARYRQLDAEFMPRLLGFDDAAEQPILLLEDLSAARWPPPWADGDLERVLDTLRRVPGTRPLPPELQRLTADFPLWTDAAAEDGWRAVARDPTAFLGLGLCSPAWLERALPRLIEASDAAVLDGDDLLHCDVRSDNICLLTDRVVLVDWNLTRRGAAAFDSAFFAPSVRLEGGPLPEEIVPAAGPLAAVVAGFFASRAGLPVIVDAPLVRWIQLRQLRVALPWAARVLGLAPPDEPWGRNAMAPIEADYAAGVIDDATWHARIEEIIGDAYLATNDPRAQSGKGGDEVDWRWSRELVVDSLPRGGSLLDIGCANGYLMESVQRWAAERGVVIEPFGVDISWRLAALAQRRLPAWADRIWVGNAMTWTPPRRFDVVHTGLDYVPAPRRRDYVLRLLRDFVLPGGRVVIRAERVVPGKPDVVAEVGELELGIGGVLERAHPRSGELRRSVWLTA